MIKIILSTASLYTYKLEHIFNIAKDVGFQGLELNISRDFATRNVELISKLTKSYNLPVVSIHAPVNLRHKNLMGWTLCAKIKRTIEMANYVHSSIIVVHTPFVWELADVYFLLNKIKFVTNNYRGNIVIENVGKTYLLGLPFNLHWFAKLASLRKLPAIAFDTSHFGSMNVDICSAYDYLKDLVRHIHLSNFAKRKEHCLLENGSLPLADFLRLLKQENYAYSIAFEFSPYSFGRSDEKKCIEILKENLSFCNKCLT